jgi:hypothetical protein
MVTPRDFVSWGVGRARKHHEPSPHKHHGPYDPHTSARIPICRIRAGMYPEGSALSPAPNDDAKPAGTGPGLGATASLPPLRQLNAAVRSPAASWLGSSDLTEFALPDVERITTFNKGSTTLPRASQPARWAPCPQSGLTSLASVPTTLGVSLSLKRRSYELERPGKRNRWVPEPVRLALARPACAARTGRMRCPHSTGRRAASDRLPVKANMIHLYCIRLTMLLQWLVDTYGDSAYKLRRCVDL